MKKLILINGIKRSGKDYLSETIKDILGENKVHIISFASPIKQIIASTFNISLSDLDEYKNNIDDYGLEIKVYPNNQSPGVIKYLDFRTILQRFGTEGAKPVFGDNIWAELGIKKALESNKEFVLIPDFRFLVEYQETMKNFNEEYKVITINIFNDDLEQNDLHSSETELKDFIFDFNINNTGQPNLEQEVRKIIENIT